LLRLKSQSDGNNNNNDTRDSSKTFFNKFYYDDSSSADSFKFGDEETISTNEGERRGLVPAKQKSLEVKSPPHLQDCLCNGGVSKQSTIFVNTKSGSFYLIIFSIALSTSWNY
jgi:hypothetical protein